MNRYRRSGLVALFASGALLSVAATAAPPAPGYNDAMSDPFAGWYTPPSGGASMEPPPPRPRVYKRAQRYNGAPRGGYWGPPPAAAYDVPPPPANWMEPPQRPEPMAPGYGYRGFDGPPPAAAYDVPPPPAEWMEPPQRPEPPAPGYGHRGFDGPPPAAAYEVPPPPTEWMEPPQRTERPSDMQPPAYRERPARPAYHGGYHHGLQRPAWSHPRILMAPDASNIDSDNDGVINLADICPGTPDGTEINVFGCGLDQPIVLTHVKFAPGSEDMTDESSAVLDIIAETLITNPDVHVEIAGHTATEFDYGQNMQMSARRAVNVMKYLVDQGVDPSHMIARGQGDTEPVSDNAEDNNRIEMSLTK